MTVARNKFDDIERSQDEKAREVEGVGQRTQSSDFERSKERNRIRVVGGFDGYLLQRRSLIYVLRSGPLKKMTRFEVGRGTKVVGSM